MGEQKIVMIAVDKLHEHPENPRKQLGDLTELADSIRANGIMQNLTVIPYYSTWHHRVMEGLYTVIIGHRRLAAAKLAGLKEVPCVITEMSQEQQLATMLAENMQRENLSVYEQACTFHQLTMDLGMTTEEIAKISGFSEQTVRHRQRMGEIDRKILKQACNRNVTMRDFEKLEKIETKEGRDKVAAALGTNNFESIYRDVRDQERWNRKKEEWISQLRLYATEIQTPDIVDGEDIPMKYIRNYGPWTTRQEKVDEPEPGVSYYFRVGRDDISVYKANYKTEEDLQLEAEEAARKADYAAKTEKLKQLTRRHYEMRMKFIEYFGDFKGHRDEIFHAAAMSLVRGIKYDIYARNPESILFKMLGLKKDAKLRDFDAFAWNCPEKSCLLAMAVTEDFAENGYIQTAWSRYGSKTVYRDNQRLDDWYYFLERLGYRTSDEELQLRRGSHPLLETKGDDG